MIQKAYDLYFANKTYRLLYYIRFFKQISSATMYVFTGAYFFDLGMPLHYILLFYGLEFGVRGSLCPFGLMFLNRFGFAAGAFTSACFMMLFFVGMSFADVNLFIGFGSLLFAAIAGAIYYPLSDVLEAVYVDDDASRGRQFTMGLIIKSLGGVIGAAGAGYLIDVYGFDAIIVFVFFALVGSSVPFLWLKNKTDYMPDLKALDVYRYLGSEKFRPYWKPFFGEQLLIIVNAVMLPIFIFMIVGKMSDLGYLIAAALVLEKIITLMAGHFIDKVGSAKLQGYSVFGCSSALLFYAFFAKTPLTAFMAETYNKVMYNIYFSSFSAGMHKQVRDRADKHLLLFGAGWQMALCFGELLVLPFYALLAYFIGDSVFYVAFVVAAYGAYLSASFFKVHQK